MRRSATRALACLAALIVVVLASTPARAGSLSYSDDTFVDADWTSVPFPFGDGGTSTVGQVATGGNPGAFRRIELAVRPAPSPGTFSALWLLQFRNDAVYDPATQGGILSVDYAEDALYLGGQNDLGVPLGVSNGTHAVSIALSQGGVLYTTTGLLADSETWATKSLAGLVASDFFRADGAAGSPDFSSTGAPMQLGFIHRVSGSIGGIGFDTATGIDHWSVTIHNVPEPGTGVLVGCSLVGLWTLRRRARSAGA